MVSINYEPLHADRRGVRHGGLSQAKLFFLLCIISAFGLLLYSHYNTNSDLAVLKDVLDEKSRVIKSFTQKLENANIELEKYKVKEIDINKEKDLLNIDIRNCKLARDSDKKQLLNEVSKNKDQMQSLLDETKKENEILKEEIESLKKDIQLNICKKEDKINIDKKEILKINDIEDPIDGKDKLNGVGEALVPKDNEEINIPEPNANEVAGIAIPNQENEGFIANDKLGVKDMQ
uniref:Uncharacterized protein n=1 Tax=Parastrongyloides trichosuri TaxID=131310 RepID=A0A0N4ZMK5_PARTI